MTVETGVSPPQTTDTGGTGSTPSNDQQAAGVSEDSVKHLIAESQKEMLKSMGLHEDQRVDQMIHGVTRKVFDIPDGKSATQHLAETISEIFKSSLLEDAQSSEGGDNDTPPSEAAVLQTTVAELQKSVKDLKDENAKVKLEAFEINRVSTVGNIIDGLGIDSKLSTSFKNLVANGLMDGVGKPYVSPQGEMVIDTQTGPVGLKPSLEGFIEQNPHWAGDNATTGSGAGRGTQTPGSPGTPFEFTPGSKGRTAVQEAYKVDAEKAEAAVDTKVSKLAETLHVPGL